MATEVFTEKILPTVSLGYGVMVTQQILVLFFLVRVRVAQLLYFPYVFYLLLVRAGAYTPPCPHNCICTLIVLTSIVFTISISYTSSA